MSYIINTINPNFTTNLENLQIVDTKDILLNDNSSVDFSEFNFLKNVELKNKDINKLINSRSGFSRFQMERIATEYKKDNFIDVNKDYSIRNVNNILNKVLHSGKKIYVNEKVFSIVTFFWDEKFYNKNGGKTILKNESVFVIKVKLKLLEKENITSHDKIKLSCETRSDQIRADIRDIFKKAPQQEIPVAEKIKGGKRKKKTKKSRKYKKSKKKYKTIKRKKTYKK